MRPGGFEPPTNSLEGCCSIHLSYGRRNNLRDFAILNVCRTYGKHTSADLQRHPLARILDHGAAMPHRAEMAIDPPHQCIPRVPFIIDTTGVGKGIADHLVAKGYAVTYFDSSTVLRDKRYGNPRAEAYMTMREAFQSGAAAIPPNEGLLAELLAVKYEVKNGGRTYIEPKDNVRDRLGHSPDLADICAMALGGAAETCSIGGYVGNLGF